VVSVGEMVNRLTIGELLAIISGVAILYTFFQSIIFPIVKKWLKIDKNANDLASLKGLPQRVDSLERRSKKDYERMEAIDEVNVIMMEALRALIRNRRTGNDVDKLKTVEDKIDEFLVGKVRN